MNRIQAVKLLDDTFKKNFDIDQFSRFIKELFNEIQINIQDKTQFVASQFREYISDCKKIAGYRDTSKKSMEILAVKLKRTSSRDRARTMQRNFIASWLSNYGVDAALVAFYGDDDEDWRLSYVKMEYDLVKNENGIAMPTKELTPAKRYSFLVGVNEPNHTCQKQFLDLVIEEKTNPLISQIEQAFSVENVTKEFFEKYKELTIKLKEAVDEILAKDQRIGAEFSNKGISAIDFSKKLMGQIVFIYFLQKKGWLGVQKRSDGTFDEWGTGPRNFLRKLFDKKTTSYDNFFNDLLEPLFYEAVSTDRSADNDYYSRFRCKIPFLNGGLFEPLNDYNWTDTDIIIPNELFSNSVRTNAGDTGTGILDVFDRYNFTVKEDEPLEKEVAIDPEMLGKVFENLLEVRERKDRGAFYTPREIVHYMCQQSLINYLETNTQNISREDIERFVQYGDIALDQTIRYMAQKERYSGKSYVDESSLVPGSIADNYRKIDKLLQDIKVVDPAVGSGAFPVGMMNEIVKARSILTLFFSPEERESRTEYNLKRQCIENCLYGVDIDPSAVEIAKLRFWLSLIVDEEKRENIQPLPNLDHKIMCGNSLLEEFEGIRLFDERLLGEIASKSPTELEIEWVKEQISRLNRVLSETRFGDQRPEIRKYAEELENLQKRKAALEKRQNGKGAQISRDQALEQALEQRIRESQIKLKELRELQKGFFNEQNRNNKKKLRERIDRIEWELIEATLKEQGREEAMAKLEQYRKTNVKPFFLWKLYFAEVFQRENPGFDVVIANPPYVRVDEIDPYQKSIYKNIYISSQGKYDLYYLFFELAKKISAQNGNFTFITPNKYCAADSAIDLRNFLFDSTSKVEIISTSRLGVFDSAANYPVISIFTRDKHMMPVTVREAKELSFKGLRTSHKKYQITTEQLNLLPYRVIPINVDQKDIDFVLGLYKNSVYVGEIIKISEGLRIPEKYEEESGDFPIVKQYQFSKYSKIKKGTYISAQNLRKITSQSSERYQNSLKRKIVISEDALEIEATLDCEKMIPQGGVYFAVIKDNIDLKIEMILGLLNSQLLSKIYEILFAGMHMGGGYLRYRSKFLEKLPVPKNLISCDVSLYEQISDDVLNLIELRDYKDSEICSEYSVRLCHLEDLVNSLYGIGINRSNFQK
jgi:hypothetical protein